jgi:hypothetical protein
LIIDNTTGMSHLKIIKKMHKSVVYSTRCCTELIGQLHARSFLPAEEYPSRYLQNVLARCSERKHSFALSWRKPRFLGRPTAYRRSPGATRSFQTLFIAPRSAGCRKYIILSLYREVTFLHSYVSCSNLMPIPFVIWHVSQTSFSGI